MAGHIRRDLRTVEHIEATDVFTLAFDLQFNCLETFNSHNRTPCQTLTSLIFA